MTALLRLLAKRLEVVAGAAVTDIELMSDDRKPHRMDTKQQLAVFDGVAPDV